MTSQKQIEQIHKNLLMNISNTVVEESKEYENFVFQMEGHVECGVLAQHKTPLQKLKALEKKNSLGPGNYDTLIEICRNSGNNYLIEDIKSAEKDIMAVRKNHEQDVQPESKKSKNVAQTEGIDGIEEVSRDIWTKDQLTQCNPGSKSRKRTSSICNFGKNAGDQVPFGFKRPRVEVELQGREKRDTSYRSTVEQQASIWSKCMLGLNCVLKVLKPFCQEVVTEQHRQILSVLAQNQSTNDIECGQCVLKELQPNHSKGTGKCPFGQSHCNCQYKGKTKCPKNVCGAIYDEIIQLITFELPKRYWRNTNIQTWCTDAWSVAKCFITTPGYASKSISDTDIAGILQVISNNKEFYTYIEDMDHIKKVRGLRNKLAHYVDEEMDKGQIDDFFDVMTSLLVNEPKLNTRPETTVVLESLKRLKNEEDPFEISSKAEIEFVSNDLLYIRQQIDEIKQNIDNLTKYQTNQKATNEDRKLSKLPDASRRVDSLETRVKQLECETEDWKQAKGKLQAVLDKQFPVELKKDPRTMQCYHKALQNDSLAENSIQVMIIGCYNHGKTSLVRRLLGQELDGKKSSNGIAVHRCIAKSNGLWKEVEEELEDKFISQPSTCSVHKHDEEPSFLSSGTSSKIESENSIQKFKNDFRKPLDTQKDLHIDLSILDLSGQFTYHATHPILLSTRAVYILVINLADDLDKKLSYSNSPGETHSKSMREYISFWVNSIHTFVGTEDGHCPPIILVGTHKDEKDIDDSKVFSEVRNLFNSSVLNHLQRETFFVSNTKPELSRPSFNYLRSLIIKVGKQLLINEIPGKWRLFDNELKMRRKHEKIINISELYKIENETDVHVPRDKDQLKLFLAFQHERGTLCYFNDDRLLEYVLIDPAFLIDAFKCLIKSKEELLARYPSKMMWRKLCDEAILQPKLLHEVWSGEFFTFRNTLLEFLQRHHIRSNVQKNDKQDVESAGYYLVPSFLKSSVNSDSIDAFLQWKTTSNVSLRYENISQKVLPILFNRILAALVGRWPISNLDNISLIFDNFVACEPKRDHAVLLILEDDGIELLTVNLLKKPVSSDICDLFRRFVKKIMKEEIYKLRSNNVQNNEELFSMTVRCREASHSCKGSTRTCGLREIESDLEIPCPDKRDHVIHIDYIRQWITDRNSLGSKCNLTSKRRLLANEYSKLAQTIGREWQQLAKTLGFSDDTIEQIEFEADNFSEQSMAYQLLLKWDERECENATFDKLVQAVLQIPCLLVELDALDKIKNLVDEL